MNDVESVETRDWTRAEKAIRILAPFGVIAAYILVLYVNKIAPEGDPSTASMMLLEAILMILEVILPWIIVLISVLMWLPLIFFKPVVERGEDKNQFDDQLEK